MSRQERILLWSSNLWNIGAGLLGPLFAVFAQQVGGDVLSITWVWGVYMLSMGFFVVVIGKVTDRIRNKARLVLAGYILNALCTFAYLWVDSPSDLFVVQLGLGLAIALSAPGWNALYDRYSGDGRRDGWVWGLSSGYEKMATGVGVIAGGYIVAATSFKTLFICMGVLQVLACLIQARFSEKGR
jgi:MFS family permease